MPFEGCDCNTVVSTPCIARRGSGKRGGAVEEEEEEEDEEGAGGEDSTSVHRPRM